MNEDHLSWADFLSILDQEMEPEKLRRLQEHLFSCHKCKQKYQEIEAVKSVVSDINKKHSPVDKGCLDDERIAAYLDGILSQTEVQSLQEHIQGCDSCFSRQVRAFKFHRQLESGEKRMISTPSWLKDKAISQFSPQASHSQSDSIPETVGKKVLRWLRQGLASPLPGYAIAGILLMFFIWQGDTNRPMPERLISFPEATGLWIYNEVPVTYRNGKMSQSKIVDERQALYKEPQFSGLVVKEKKDCGLTFTWPKMEDTQKYHFVLFSPDRADKQILVSVDTSNNEYDYCYKKFGSLNHDRLYKWEVSGKYGKGLHFKAKGMFTLVETKQMEN